MLKREVKEMVKYLLGEKESFKVVFANGIEETIEYKGYCWILNNKAYSDEELIEKMVRYQNNEKKFIIKFEEIEEVEEVENLNDDLFQDEHIQYCEEAIERETKKENVVSEIELQVNDLKKLIGKKVFVKRYSYDGYYYNDSEKVETFTIDDFKCYSDDIKAGDIELWEIEYTGKYGDYYLITFKDLIFIC